MVEYAGYALEWLHLLLRSLHVVVAIAWIGASFYFVWLDNHLTSPTDPVLQEKGVGGELWAVHGGGFYHPQKYKVAPKHLPANVHWFYWESYATWLSGIALFSVLYLFQAEIFLIDKTVWDIQSAWAILAACSFLPTGWLVYDGICRLFGHYRQSERIMAGLIALMLVGATWLACHMFAGRAAYLLIGAMLATCMTANVFFWIIPGQRKVVAALRVGATPDPLHGLRGKQRSVHNTYFTLPVLFAMVSNHFSLTYGHAENWLVLLLLMLAGALIRRFFVLRHHGIQSWKTVAASVALLLGVIAWLAPQAQSLSTQHAPAVAFAQIQTILQNRCVPCHAAQPSLLPVAGKGIQLDQPEHITAHAQQIYQQVVRSRTMPMGNMTHMTEEEREMIAHWFQAGAKVE